MALRQCTTTARRLRDNLRTATGTRVSDQTIRNRLRANNLRCRRQLFDHHSYHVTERPDVIGAHFICSGNVFSGVEWCSLMNPGLVSSSTTVGFMSTDVLGSASLTLTLDNVTGSVVAASWCGAASLSTTGPPFMWWMAIWQESAISMRLSGRWFYQAFSRLAAGQFCSMTMPDPTAPGWWLTFSDNKVSPGWIGQHIRLTWPQ